MSLRDGVELITALENNGVNRLCGREVDLLCCIPFADISQEGLIQANLAYTFENQAALSIRHYTKRYRHADHPIRHQHPPGLELRAEDLITAALTRNIQDHFEWMVLRSLTGSQGSGLSNLNTDIRPDLPPRQ